MALVTGSQHRLEVRTRRVFVAGVCLSIAAAGLVAWLLHRERVHAARLDATRLAATMQLGLAMPIEPLHAIAAFMAALGNEGTTQRQFAAVAEPFLARHREIVALEWFPRVPGDKRDLFEFAVRRDQPQFEMREPATGGGMVTAQARAEHFPLTFFHPLNPESHGLDISFEEIRVVQARRALAEGRTALSDPLPLVEDTDGSMSVAAYTPVPKTTWLPALDPALQSGVVVGLFRLVPLFDRILAGLALDGVALEVHDLQATAPALFRRGAPERVLHFDFPLQFVDRTYQFTVAPVVAPIGVWPWLVLVIGATGAYLARHLSDAVSRARRIEERYLRLGQYVLEGEIARGGMGTVYRARHALLRRPTAIKVSHAASDEEFEREAQITCLLSHPNTVQLYDYGQGQDGMAYFAMEYVEGYHLERLVGIEGPLPVARALRILIQAAGSLAEAHSLGLLHRDVNPRNIMVTARGGVYDFVKVLDFGLARRAGTGDPAAGAPLIEGTPGYVAPEVLAGHAADERSDLYALGCVAYFLLEGRPPHPVEDSVTATITRVLTASPAPLAAAPPAVARLVQSCLQSEPGKRPPSMSVFAGHAREALASAGSWNHEQALAWWTAHPPTAAAEVVVDAAAARYTIGGMDRRLAASTTESPGGGRARSVLRLRRASPTETEAEQEGRRA